MKKRVISLTMVIVLLMSLVPMGAFAAIGDTVIITQPKDVSADVGNTVSFTIKAENPNSTKLKYLWFDAKQVNTDNINSFASFIAEAEKAKLGDKETLTLKNITEDMDGMTVRCAVYYTDPIIPRGLSLSDTATLSIRPPECEEHTLIKTEAADPTCAKDGNIEYYYCTVCERYYRDEACTQETTLDECTIPKLNTHDNIEHVAAKAETCCEKGCIEHWACKTCGQAFEDEAGTDKLDKSAVEIPIDATKHKKLVHHDALAATCSEKGMEEHWYCDGCDKYFTDAAGTESISKAKLDVDKDKTNHSDLEYYPPKAASCKEEGNIAYYYCSGCKDYFSDAAGTKEISKADTTLKKLDHSYNWVAIIVDGVEYHAEECSKCGDLKNTGSHTGGEAYCSGKAVCDICGLEYGTVDPDNHIHTEKQIIDEPTLEKDGRCNIYCKDCEKIVAENVKISFADICEHELVKVEEVPAKCEKCTDAEGVKEHYECSICGTLFSDADGKNRIDDPATLTIEPLEHYIIDISGAQVPNPKVLGWDYDEIGHWQVCKFCGLRYSTYNTHTYLGIDKPTCCTGNVCMTCGYDDGKVDPENHSGGTETVGAVEPEGDKPGYTGDTKCLGCGEIIEQGRPYYAACPDGCAATLEFVPAKEKTCTEDGVKAHYICTVCGNMYLKSDGTQPTDDAGIVDPCTGHDLHPGMNALTSTDLASLMKNLDISAEDLANMIKNGDFDKDVTFESLLAKLSVKDIDHCYNDTYHWLGCQRCGKTLEDIRPELEAKGIFINERWYELSKQQAHSGGTADCKNKAICTECGEYYGQLGNHRYDAVVTQPTCTEKGYTTHTCDTCKVSCVDSYTPAAGHKISRGRCEYCMQIFKNPFDDVDSSSIYYEHVMWAYYYNPQITAGTDVTLFSPTAPCTRGQVVTFLWRAAGRPQPTSTSINFSDVSNSGSCQPYYTAILWAAEKGITTGYGDGTFRPHAQVTRAEFVTFLWRYYGKPSPSSLNNPFVDVNPDSIFYKAILWAAEQGITKGYGNDDFQPNKLCSRWQVVAFLHRAIDERE